MNHFAHSELIRNWVPCGVSSSSEFVTGQVLHVDGGPSILDPSRR